MMQGEMNNQSRYVEAGAFLKAARNAKGLTLEDVVDELKKLEVPSSKSVIHRMERGEQMASNLGDAQFVRALTQVLGVSSSELMALTGHIPFRELKFGAEKQHLAELQKQAKRLATRLRTVSDEFANFLDGEIEQVSTELATARRQETRLLHQRRVDDRLDRERALDGLRELTLERLWALPDLEINRWLHRVFGRTRLVVNAKTKVIVGRTKK